MSIKTKYEAEETREIALRTEAALNLHSAVDQAFHEEMRGDIGEIKDSMKDIPDIKVDIAIAKKSSQAAVYLLGFISTVVTITIGIKELSSPVTSAQASTVEAQR